MDNMIKKDRTNVFAFYSFYDLGYFFNLINLNFNMKLYSKTCLNRTPLGLTNLFSLDRYLVYTGSNYTDI
jgi:hypothetical protein